MSEQVVSIKVRTRGGHVDTLQVAELIEVDGQPYKSTDDISELEALVNHLSGRIAAVESMIGAGNG